MAENQVGNFKYAEFISEPKPGETGVIRNINNLDGLIATPLAGKHTLYEIFFQHSFQVYRDQPWLGTRSGSGIGRYRWKTYAEAQELAEAFGSAVANMCPQYEHEGTVYTFLGTYSPNWEEWMIADFGCIMYSLVNVTLYDALGPDTSTYILEQTELETLLLSEDNLERILELKRNNQAGSLRNVIQIQPLTQEQRQTITSTGLNAFSYDEIIAIGRVNPSHHRPPTPKTLYTFSYTSGSTGKPKGAMVSHGNMTAEVSTVIDSVGFTKDDIHMSYLPLPHIFERLMVCNVLFVGASIGFISGSIDNLADDLVELKPTVIPSVPRLWNRFYDTIQTHFAKVDEKTKTLFKQAVEEKLHNFRTKGQYTHPSYDDQVFGPCRALMGGRARVMLTASAPINPEILEFLQIAFCAPILQAYGMTENSGISTIAWFHDPDTGHVGGPGQAVDAKLVSLEHIGYSVDDVVQGQNIPRGELCMRGPIVIQGYFKMPEVTAETFDSDGWLHSGDVAQLNPNGTLKIIDRVKSIFKLQQGEYVAPEKLEYLFNQTPLIAQSLVHGDSVQRYPVAIIVPDEVVLKVEWARLGIEGTSFEALCRNHEVKKMLMQVIEKVANNNKFMGYERPRNIYVSSELFSPDNVLTPTFKMRRQIAAKYFREKIDELYNTPSL